MTTTTLDVAAALGHDLCQRIGAGRYDLWFKTTTKFRCEAGQLVVGVPNRFYQEWLQKTFAADVQATAQAILHEALEVRFVIDAELYQAARQREASADVPGSGVSAQSQRPTLAIGAEPAVRTRRWRNLDDFVEGSCNRVARAAACHVVEAPGQEANPLVLHGPVGAGKSHLLEGVASGLRKSRPEWRILFVTAEEFTHRFVQAMRHNRIGAFRKQFRSCDALLLDDLHFLAKKNATQEEFLHTLDTLQNEGRPVATACDCHPRLTDGLLPELVDRLQGGAIWGLTYPDAETRAGILRQLSRRPGAAPLPEAVLQLLATQLRGNVRELEGAAHSVRHLAKVAGRPINVDLAKEALADVLRHSVRIVQMADVDRAVCAALGLPAGTLQSSKRAWMVSHPRMLAVYLARKHTTATHTEIGHYFGNRNHSTVVAAEKKVRLWQQDDADLPNGKQKWRVRDLLDRIERELLA